MAGNSLRATLENLSYRPSKPFFPHNPSRRLLWRRGWSMMDGWGREAPGDFWFRQFWIPMATPTMRTFLFVVACTCFAQPSFAVDAPPDMKPVAKAAEKPMPPEAPDEHIPGRSSHGEAFNEGPRQAAYKMGGTGNVHLEITSKHPEAQAFFDQGIGQLHGFWYFEAERSFRQVVKLDHDCAMAYWGLALANVNNEKRAKEFLADAVKRKDKCSERERRLIEALNAFRTGDQKKKKDLAEAYAQALEKLVMDFPDELELKALLVLQIYNNKSNGIPIQSQVSLDALMNEIFAKEPLHPVHHYRIHLWDHMKAQRALTSAALCGKAAPSIAHMWHMSGHTYSDLKRYGEAAWHQEAAARTDHARMMRDRILPDQIHNYAHNNEWLIRDLVYVGRMNDALVLSKNMIELPQHPKYNTKDKHGSYYYGRQRLVEVLEKFEQWPETLRLADTGYLAPSDDEASQVAYLRRIGAAAYRGGDVAAGDVRGKDLEGRLAKLREEADKAATESDKKVREKLTGKPAEVKVKPQPPEAPDEFPAPAKPAEKKPDEKKPAEKPKAEVDEAKILMDMLKARQEARKPFDDRIKTLEKALDELRGHAATQRGEFAKAYPLLKSAGTVDKYYLLRMQFAAGEKDAALKDAAKEADQNGSTVLPIATWADLAWQADKKDDAKKAMEKLRPLACRADLAAPPFARLAPIAKHLGWPDDWRGPAPKIGEAEQLPSIDSLGPLTWSPSPSPSWSLSDTEGKTHTLSEFHGKPLVLILFLGAGCLHCAEQLHAFAPKTAEFEAAGFRVAAISSDDREGLQFSLKNYKDGKFPFLLLADGDKSTFKAYRAFDDFEDEPLHATLIIDAKGRIRWQDIGHQPFMDVPFVLKEGQRMMKIGE